MATKTLGTNATTTLTAVQYRGNSNTLSMADIATMASRILNDGANPGGQISSPTPSAKPIWPGAFARDGLLYIPNRGVLKCFPGDWVAVDANGWPILVSANAIAGGTSPSATTSWTHS